MLFVSGVLLLWSIIVEGVPKYTVHEMYHVRDSPKGNLTSRITPMCMLSHEDRDINPSKRGRWNKISSPKEGLISSEHLVTPVPPYPLGGGIEGIVGILLRESWEVNLLKKDLNYLFNGRQIKLDSTWAKYFNVALLKYMGNNSKWYFVMLECELCSADVVIIINLVIIMENHLD